MVIKFKKAYLLLVICLLLAVSAVRCITPAASASSTAGKTPLPVVMYHQVTKSVSRAGAYCVTLAELENDFKYITDCGYTSITVAQLLAHVNHGTPLPQKPIMLTFDDGYETLYSYVYPLLEKYGLCAVGSVVGAYTDLYSEINDHSLSYSYLTWDEVRELTNGGTIEIQNHSYDLHKVNNCGRKGAKRVNGESFDEYSAFLSADLEKMQNVMFEKTGKKPTAFTYPFGCYSKESKQVLKSMGFEAALICEEKMNYIDTESTEWLYRICRYNRPHGQSSSAFFAKLSVTK